MRVFKMRLLLGIASLMAFGGLLTTDVFGQRGRGGGGGGARMGGGGGRPSMGAVGGGGARPSMPTARPSAPAMSRPNMPSTRPSTPNFQKPTFGNANAKPSIPSRPSMPNSVGGGNIGVNRPSLGGAGNISRPTTLPGSTTPGTTRPSFPNSGNRPATLPGTPGITTRPAPGVGNKLPGTGNGGNRPSIGDRPTLGNVNKPATLPGITNRPSTLPGVINKPSTLPGDINKPSTLPGVGNRPTTLPGNITRPGVGGDRPTTLPGTVKPPTIGGGNRPGIGGDRPNFGGDNRPGNRPGNRPNDRPVIGGNKPGWNVDRPNIGNGNNNNIVNRPINRPNIGNGSGNNINIGNTVNVGNRYPNRPNWDLDPGYSRPSWGLNGNDWHNNWNHNCINNHHNWYNGCWHGYWGSSWYAPVAWGAVGWGLNSFTTGWGYNTAYYNPYYATPAVAQSVPYDYSQPVVVNNYVSSDSTSQGGDSQATQVNNDQDVALAAFDKGLDQFKSGAYANALAEFNAALKKLPGDPVVHETRCLALFATADYSAAAAGLNSLLSAAPGMDWTTMSGLYGDANDYTKQFRALESYCVSNPTDAPSHFVLAYHYLVTGAKDAAVDALKVVVKAQPKDVTAKRMLTALAPETVPAPATPAAPTPTTTAGNAADASPAETDLVGVWTAKANDSMITLSITEDSKFTWTASEKGQTAIELKGDLSSAADGISLQTPDQGTVAGAVKSNGPDSWNFLISGSPANDPGLKFDRKK